MVILVVDNNPDRLWGLVRNIRFAFPNDTVEYTHDSLMAGRFCNANRVDMVFAALVMRHLDGDELARIVRRKLSNANVFLMGDEDELGNYLFDEADGYTMLQLPVTEEKLKAIANETVNLT